jgi:alkylhydroperoxidase family enzyme
MRPILPAPKHIWPPSSTSYEAKQPTLHRVASLIELQVAQLLGLEREESALGEKMKSWYSSPEFSEGEKAILEITEQFVLDVHSVTDEQFEKLRKYFSTPDILAMLFHVALCDGFGKLEKVA